MDREQNLPSIDEAEKALLAPLFTSNVMTSADASVVLTVFDWHGEVCTKLMLHSPVGSQTMILDREALADLAFAFAHAHAAATKL